MSVRSFVRSFVSCIFYWISIIVPGTWAVMFCLSGNTPINSSVIVPLELSPMNSNVAVLLEIVISPMGSCVTVLLGIYTFHRQLCYCPVENIFHGQLCYPVWNIFHGQLCYCPVGNISHGPQCYCPLGVSFTDSCAIVL